mmetsp:Transcript_80909/g.160354  ORF Transcript_80909/g.160354 Transcript_80909/m.160354 type:complete len:250 (-) Transcript_80909:7-756(-)
MKRLVQNVGKQDITEIMTWTLAIVRKQDITGITTWRTQGTTGKMTWTMPTDGMFDTMGKMLGTMPNDGTQDTTGNMTWTMPTTGKQDTTGNITRMKTLNGKQDTTRSLNQHGAGRDVRRLGAPTVTTRKVAIARTRQRVWGHFRPWATVKTLTCPGPPQRIDGHENEIPDFPTMLTSRMCRGSLATSLFGSHQRITDTRVRIAVHHQLCDRGVFSLLTRTRNGNPETDAANPSCCCSCRSCSGLCSLCC